MKNWADKHYNICDCKFLKIIFYDLKLNNQILHILFDLALFGAKGGGVDFSIKESWQKSSYVDTPPYLFEAWKKCP